MGSRDRSFYRALMISLILHGALLLSLQLGWWGKNAGAAERYYHRPYPALVVTTAPAVASPPVPARVSASSAAPAPGESSASTESADPATIDTPSSSAPENSTDPGGTGTLPPSVRPEREDNTAIKVDPEQNNDAETSKPAGIPVEKGPDEPGTKLADSADNAGRPGSSGVNPVGQQSFPSPVHPEIALRSEIERQLRFYIEKFKRYPDAARRRGLEGEVELYLSMRTGKQVELSRAMLVRSAGNTLLDREAQRLVESFFPYCSDINGGMHDPAGSDITGSDMAGTVVPKQGGTLTTTVRISYELR